MTLVVIVTEPGSDWGFIHSATTDRREANMIATFHSEIHPQNHVAVREEADSLLGWYQSHRGGPAPAHLLET